MRIGISFPQNELSGDPRALHRFAVTAEDLGYDHVLLYDHVVGAVRGVERERPVPVKSYDEKDPFHDPFVAFGYLAAVTSRIELITGILILPQRQTVLVARQAADVALLSGGRLSLGVGIGYNPVEFHALGMDFSTRGRRLDEQLGYLRQLWTGEPITVTGEFDQIDRAALVPVPPAPIPILLGGSSEKAFRRAAKQGDGFIFGYGHRPEAAQAWQRIQQLLGEEGRTVEGFRSIFNLLPDEPGTWMDQEVEALPRLRDIGVTDVSLASSRNGLKGIDEHLAFITKLKHRADAILS